MRDVVTSTATGTTLRFAVVASRPGCDEWLEAALEDAQQLAENAGVSGVLHLPGALRAGNARRSRDFVGLVLAVTIQGDRVEGVEVERVWFPARRRRNPTFGCELP